MVAFEVFRNDKRLCVAGVGDFGVLIACVNWVAHRPEKLDQRRTAGISEQQPTELNVHVSGLQSDEATPLHKEWTDTTLQVGDQIKIHVIDATHVDPATAEHRDKPGDVLEQKKAYVRQYAKELGWEIREP
jgi:hypothetical protein